MRSVTRLDGQAVTELRQTWIWTKRMPLGELAYARVIRVRGFEWLIAPRIYVRTLLGKFAVFYAADPRMIAQFERLAAELKSFPGLLAAPPRRTARPKKNGDLFCGCEEFGPGPPRRAWRASLS